MFKRILVPLDGSPAGEAILDHARNYAAPKAEIFLLHVLPNVTPPVGSPSAQLLALPEQAEAYLDTLADRFPAMRVRIFVDTGDPADRIVRVALGLNIDLIAMMTRAPGTASRVLLGSVAQDVVRGTSLPVLLVRPGVAAVQRPANRFLVPLDGSVRSQRILDVLRNEKTDVVLLQVAETIDDSRAGLAHLDRPVRRVMETPARRLEEIGDALAARGVTSSPLLVHGDVVRQILAQARARDIDAIAMATHGRTGLERLVMGSVAEGVLRGADCPVLLLRAIATPKLQEVKP